MDPNVDPAPAGTKPRKGNPVGSQGGYDPGVKPSPATDPSAEVDEG